MGFTERQKSELKNITKEITKEILKEFMSDDVFLEAIAKKVAEKVNQQIDRISAEVSTLESKIFDIQGENEELSKKVEDLEQKLRLDQLRFYCVPETDNGILKANLEKIFSSKLAVSDPNIKQCYRISKHQGKSKPRPVIIKFGSVQHRNAVFSVKRQLKGSNMVLAEDLIKSRFGLLNFAKDKLGKNNVWTNNGNLFTVVDGKRTLLKTEEAILNLCK
nr:uncharacterized protein LOC111516412 [Leptinotarsa decemlineata]